MRSLEGWGFLCLVGSGVSVAMALSLFSGTGQVVGCLAGTALGILSGGLYAASASPDRRARAEPDAQPDR